MSATIPLSTLRSMVRVVASANEHARTAATLREAIRDNVHGADSLATIANNLIADAHAEIEIVRIALNMAMPDQPISRYRVATFLANRMAHQHRQPASRLRCTYDRYYPTVYYKVRAASPAQLANDTTGWIAQPK